jgi:hypothetical protein
MCTCGTGQNHQSIATSAYVAGRNEMLARKGRLPRGRKPTEHNDLLGALGNGSVRVGDGSSRLDGGGIDALPFEGLARCLAKEILLRCLEQQADVVSELPVRAGEILRRERGRYNISSGRHGHLLPARFPTSMPPGSVSHIEASGRIWNSTAIEMLDEVWQECQQSWDAQQADIARTRARACGTHRQQS